MQDRNLEDDELDECYLLFLEEELLSKMRKERRPIINFDDAEAADDLSDDELLLQEIMEIEHVNALSIGQSIPIHKNLTIIFGVNGSGKSGYTRLLNNSFGGRGDKRILPNVFAPKAGQPSCKFSFSNTSGVYELSYPANGDNSAFQCFSVYDSACALVHLEQENGLLFTPEGFGFFNKLLSLFEQLKNKHNDKISESRPSNQFLPSFQHENIIREFVATLGADTKLEDLKDISKYGDSDKERLDLLMVRKAELIKLDIPKKLLEMQSTQAQLKDFIVKLETLSSQFSTNKLLERKDVLSRYIQVKEIADAEGIEQFKELSIDALGSEEWKQFLSAALKYADIVETSKGPFPQDGDHCLLCLQPLGIEQIALIGAYWALLKSQASAELAVSSQLILNLSIELSNLIVPTFDEHNTLFAFIQSRDPVLTEKYKKIISDIVGSKADAEHNLLVFKNERIIGSYTLDLGDLKSVDEKIAEDILDLITKNPEVELEDIEKEINLLNDKFLIDGLREKMELHVSSHKWAKKAEGLLSRFRSNALTSKQGELFAAHITDRYLDLFAKECELLDAPRVVTINQRSVKGQTLRRLKIGGELANQVLSEGESRAISLADFLTEVGLDGRNKGVIFDDPVTSLDHERKDKIAKRLAQEALSRQVIIFTHDISFLTLLQGYAEKLLGNEYKITTIRKFGDSIGIISGDLPWVAQKVKDRIGYLKNSLVRLKKLEKEGLEDEYKYGVKTWYGLLREAWERSVEERLLKGVVHRFSFAIETQKLKKIIVTPELIAEIDAGMTEASKWVHDAAAELNPSTPGSAKLEADLDLFHQFAQKCVAA